jgi:hypothetical protein
MPTRDELLRLTGISEALADLLDRMDTAEQHGELAVGLADAIVQAVVDSQIVLRCHDCGSHQIERVFALSGVDAAT